MPTDKWGIPFLYPSKKTAGITNKGTGFFWQQHNNILDDDGMIRFGKELEDVRVINESTGEWEFPYLSEGDGLSMSGPTGHHTGGENHGCQGFTYMIDGNFETGGPPSFRFRKETYHVEYDDHPSGSFTHPSATEVISDEWKGMCWVRYNRKDGISAGKDSVVCEVWWNDDPTADITKWVMLKRVEDKGRGITNWGVNSSTCDGEPYQVGTWSNIQFRFKSDSSDFSIHPLIPESNDDPVVHSIGKENMSFADSAARGYGKRADMPRDVEMKCLFKWNGGGSGKCRFKNVSLREIDPTQDFDDTPDNPDPVGGPTNTTRIKGNFRVEVDVNQAVNSVCAVGGLAKFYDFLRTDDKEISDSTTFGNITAVGAVARNSSSILVGKIVKQLNVNLKINGSPGATPTIGAKIWDSDNNIKYTSSTTFAPNTLTTSYAEKTFDFTSNTYTIQSGDQIGIEWTGTSDTNYVVIGIRRLNLVDGDNTCFTQYDNADDVWDDITTYDFGAVMYSDNT